MGTFKGRLRDPVVGRPRDQMMGRSGDVPGRRSNMFFKFNSETFFDRFDTLIGYSSLYSEL